MNESDADVTVLLNAWMSGDQQSFDRAFQLVYEDLHRVAHAKLRKERAGHILQTTALVNESYLRLGRLRRMSWKDRAHFCAMSARVMRRILIDFKRANPDLPPPAVENELTRDTGISIDALIVDEALTKLAEVDARKAQIAEMKFFGDLTAEQIATVLDMSVQTINRDWSFARAWLLRELTGSAQSKSASTNY